MTVADIKLAKKHIKDLCYVRHDGIGHKLFWGGFTDSK